MAIALLEEFRKVDPEMHIHTAWIFLLIAKYEGCSQYYLTTITGYTRTTISRNSALLSELGSRTRPGYKLIEQRVDPEDRRSRLLVLTPKGRSVYRSVLLLVGNTDDEGPKSKEEK
ncbi:hypothetical protein [Amorphus sp. MBR-141]